jgi:squalene-hopene/tetraprenyl-beta-curcumene cyclase
MSRRWPTTAALFFALVGSTFASVAFPQDEAKQVDHEKIRQQMIAKAIHYLQTKGRAEDGSYSSYAGSGVTSLVANALLKNGRSAKDPLVANALDWLQQHIQKDGGIHVKDSLYRNYETSVAVMALAAANEGGKYDKTIRNADKFLKGLQWDETEGVEKSNTGFGDGGYGKHNRPDMSNTGFLIEALKAAGNDADSQAIQRALVFVSRSQNLESDDNKTKHATKNPDGGFYYTPWKDGESQAGKTPNGGLRSYGSMTYTGLKSMIYAGVDAKDKRVQAAHDWISKHYTVQSNPGMKNSGLFYYYHVFAKALDALGVDQIEDADGVKHNWRKELIEELAKRQRPDGSWSNDNERWLEGDSSLVTAFVLMALAHSEVK